jgi:hypothetical protein
MSVAGAPAPACQCGAVVRSSSFGVDGPVNAEEEEQRGTGSNFGGVQPEPTGRYAGEANSQRQRQRAKILGTQVVASNSPIAAEKTRGGKLNQQQQQRPRSALLCLWGTESTIVDVC